MALKGIRVVELAGLAPAPFCGMILADFGAKVIRVDRPQGQGVDALSRGKQSIIVDLKKQGASEVIRKLCRSADVLLEPYRPGIMERLGLGPNVLLRDNPQLIYARLSGFGQSGPLAAKAGHDINYIALSGVLSMLGRKGERPYPPINLLADFAGGGLMCTLGIVLSLFERQVSGQGQVVDTNMVHGSAYVASFLWTTQGLPIWGGERGENILDGGAPYYDIYETKDGKYVSVGALEPQFFQELLKGLNISPSEANQMEEPSKLHQKFQNVFKTRTRDEWSAVFKDYDACVHPVLDRDEASVHSHNKATAVFLHNPVTGQKEPAPAPRLSRTPGVGVVVPPSPRAGQHTVEVLSEAGFEAQEISHLLQHGVIDVDRKAKL